MPQRRIERRKLANPPIGRHRPAAAGLVLDPPRTVAVPRPTKADHPDLLLRVVAIIRFSGGRVVHHTAAGGVPASHPSSWRGTQELQVHLDHRGSTRPSSWKWLAKISSECRYACISTVPISKHFTFSFLFTPGTWHFAAQLDNACIFGGCCPFFGCSCIEIDGKDGGRVDRLLQESSDPSWRAGWRRERCPRRG